MTTNSIPYAMSSVGFVGRAWNWLGGASQRIARWHGAPASSLMRFVDNVFHGFTQ